MNSQKTESATRILAIIPNLVLPGFGTLLVKKWGQAAAQITLILLVVVQEELTGLHPLIMASLFAGVLIWSVVTVLSTDTAPAAATMKKNKTADIFMLFLISGASVAIWGVFMGVTMGFVGISEPLPFPLQANIPAYWIVFLVKYYPLITGGALVLALLLTRFSRLVAYLLVLSVPASFACVIFIVWQRIDDPSRGNVHENTEQVRFATAVAERSC